MYKDYRNQNARIEMDIVFAIKSTSVIERLLSHANNLCYTQNIVSCSWSTNININYNKHEHTQLVYQSVVIFHV